jgi:hypothetical protein
MIDAASQDCALDKVTKMREGNLVAGTRFELAISGL